MKNKLFGQQIVSKVWGKGVVIQADYFPDHYNIEVEFEGRGKVWMMAPTVHQLILNQMNRLITATNA